MTTAILSHGGRKTKENKITTLQSLKLFHTLRAFLRVYIVNFVLYIGRLDELGRVPHVAITDDADFYHFVFQLKLRLILILR